MPTHPVEYVTHIVSADFRGGEACCNDPRFMRRFDEAIITGICTLDSEMPERICPRCLFIWHSIMDEANLPETKVCNRCNTEKPLGEFYRSPQRFKQGIYPHCKACHIAWKREHERAAYRMEKIYGKAWRWLADGSYFTGHRTLRKK